MVVNSGTRKTDPIFRLNARKRINLFLEVCSLPSGSFIYLALVTPLSCIDHHMWNKNKAGDFLAMEFEPATFRPTWSSLQPHLHYRTMPLSSTRTVGPFQAGSDPEALQRSPTTNLDQDPDIPRACTSIKSWLARLGFKPHATENSKKDSIFISLDPKHFSTFCFMRIFL